VVTRPPSQRDPTEPRAGAPVARPPAPAVATPRATNDYIPDRAVAGQGQARATVALRDALAARPDVDAVVFHTLFDVPSLPATDPEHGFGWVAFDAHGQPRAKPALAALGATGAAG
jgi:hypothetical protein